MKFFKIRRFLRFTKIYLLQIKFIPKLNNKAKLYVLFSFYYKFLARVNTVKYTPANNLDNLLPKKNNKILCYYINLENRLDRKLLLLKELSRLNFIEINRFNAISDKNGLLGCVKSHISVLEDWDENKHPLLMICEDDIEFKIDAEELESIIHFFSLDNNLHCLCLGFSASRKKHYNNHFDISNTIKTTSCYIVKNTIKNSILDSFNLSRELLENGINPSISALDIVWFQLQNKLNFAITKMNYVSQISSYSNIQNKIV